MYLVLKPSRTCVERILVALLLLLLNIHGSVPAVQPIGGNQTVVQGGTVPLPCRLTGIDESVSQVLWKRETRGVPENTFFYSIQVKNGGYTENVVDGRVTFNGDFTEKNGSLLLSNTTLLDEGKYDCVFTMFPSGLYGAKVTLNIQVPPVTGVEDDRPALGDKETSLATCTAAASRPPAHVSWLTGALAGKLTATNNVTHHDNGTTTTVSSLSGVPTMDIHNQEVQCVITCAALAEERRIPFILQVYYPPSEANISATSKDSYECVADSNPSAAITWSRPGQAWPSAVIREDATLRFPSMSADLGGLYRCDASNVHGRARTFLLVHVESGTCSTCWTLFSLLLVLIVVAAVFWYLLKSGILHRMLAWREPGPLTLEDPVGTATRHTNAPLRSDSDVSAELASASDPL